MSQSRPPIEFPTLASAPVAPLPPQDWDSLLTQAGVALEPRQQHQLRDLVTLLIAANRLTNLTAVREPDAIWRMMIFDALTLGPQLKSLPDGTSVADFGCGGGFPGLPLAVLLPGLSFTLIDATAKKIAFVRHAAAQLGLGHVTAVAGRAEELAAAGGGKYREYFEVVLARAVAPLPMLLELTAPLARAPGASGSGRLMLVKGERADEELRRAKRAMDLLRVKLDDAVETPVGKVLVFSKTAATAAGYPRSNGAPRRKPL